MVLAFLLQRCALSTRVGSQRRHFVHLQDLTPGTCKIRGRDGRTEGSQQLVKTEKRNLKLLRSKFLMVSREKFSSLVQCLPLEG